MSSIDKNFKENCLKYINIYQFDIFKKSYPNIYSAIISSIKDIQNKSVENENLTIEKKGIKNLRLKEGKKTNFIFLGVFSYKGDKVVLFELIETIGTYYLKDTNIVNKLKDYKLGTKVGLEGAKNDKGENVIHLNFNAYNDSEEIGGLFSQTSDYTDGKEL